MTDNKKRENYYVDFLRFLCAIVIMCYHSWVFTNDTDSFFRTGYLAVNFYFILTGYLMMRSLHNKSKDTHLFIWGKIKRLLPGIILAFIIAYPFAFGKEALIPNKENITRLLSNDVIADLFKLKAFGPGGVLNSAWWYISAMLFDLAILYPLAKKYGKKYITYIAPMIIFITFALSRFFDISFSYHSGVTLIFCNGVFKGLIYICLGNISYEISCAIKNKYNNKKIYLSLLEVLLTVLMFYEFYSGIIGTVLFSIILLMLLSISFSERTYSGSVFKHKIWKYLGNYGFYLYLIHESIRKFYQRQNTNEYISMFKKYALVAFTAALVMYIILDIIYPLIKKQVLKKNGKLVAINS